MAPARLLLSIAATAILLGCGGTGTIPEQVPAMADTTAKVAPPANGPQVIQLSRGGRMEGNMRNGERVGSWISYHPNGVIWSRSIYRNGVEHGPTEVFHDNGRTYYTGFYDQGKPSGEWVFFDANGVEVKRVQYDSTGAVIEVDRE
ncbi:MAG: toxin-antitoxin system YwqK family antitoxin [Flavobacteriales bacterium]